MVDFIFVLFRSDRVCGSFTPNKYSGENFWIDFFNISRDHKQGWDVCQFCIKLKAKYSLFSKKQELQEVFKLINEEIHT